MEEVAKESVNSNRRPEQVDLSLLMDVPLQVTVELGRARMTIESLLKLNQGSVVELNQVIGEPLDILVNNKLMARGEAVVVRDKFAIRIVDVVSPERRIENLR
ncbi:MAG TPA: flagellar motor switch protein FliN [Methylomirabilota bacterium]|nr:flagellar motor switch protein FliN [Methylomirabilota bacterium]